MTAACGFSPISEEKGQALWVNAADLALLNYLYHPSGHLGFSVGRKAPLGHGLRLRRDQVSLYLLQRAQITFVKTYLCTCKLKQRESACWGLGFLPPSVLPCAAFGGQLKNPEVKQLLQTDLGADRVPRLLKMKEKEQNTFPHPNLLL